MKKTTYIFLTAALSILFVSQIYAQAGDELPLENDIPGVEFTVNAMGGLSSLYYKVSIPPSLKLGAPKWNPSFLDGLGGGGGFGMIVHLNKHWGFSTGLEAAWYRAKISAIDGLIMSYEIVNPEDRLFFNKNNFVETQEVIALELPLALQFMTPFGAAKRHNFYVEAGGRLSYALKAGYVQNQSEKITAALWKKDKGFVSASGGAEEINPFWKDHKSPELEKRYEGKLDMGLNLMGTLETGVRWRLGQGMGLYTGIYANLGIINPIKGGYYAYAFDESKGESHSILETRENPYIVDNKMFSGGVGFRPAQSSDRMAPMRTLTAGVRVRFAFGKVSKPIPVIVPSKPDTVIITKVVVDTVEKVKVVHDTVTVVKEIPVEIKQTMIEISNTLFAFNKFNLNEDAQRGLDKVAVWLNENPKLNVEISGHTDGKGTQEYNQKLSESRAKAVYDYFVEHGVKADRLSYKGYGKINPIADNSTEAGRKKNRRVELNILNL